MRIPTLVLGLSVLCLGAPTALAGPLSDAMDSRWLGAWVVLGAEVRSNCDAAYTDNRINGTLSAGRGRFGFEVGELARVVDVDVHRSRVDVRLELGEPLLVAHQDGPFTLYDRIACRVELEIEVPRAVVRRRNADALDDALAAVMQRFPTRAAAEASGRANGRRCDPFPPDYDRTVAEYNAWKAEQLNRQVDARIAEAREELRLLTRSVRTDDTYLDGFAAGVALWREKRAPDCPSILGTPFSSRRSDAPAGLDDDGARVWQQGFRDGQALVHFLRVLDRAPGCYVAVPGAALE